MSNRGFSIIEVLVALTLLGASAVAVMTASRDLLIVHQQARKASGEHFLRRYLREMTSCRDTYAFITASSTIAATCNGSTKIDVFSHKVRKITEKSSTATRIGNFAVKSTCMGNRILFSALQINPHSTTLTPAINAATGKAMDWKDPLNGVPLDCKQTIAAGNCVKAVANKSKNGFAQWQGKCFRQESPCKDGEAIEILSPPGAVSLVIQLHHAAGSLPPQTFPAAAYTTATPNKYRVPVDDFPANAYMIGGDSVGSVDGAALDGVGTVLCSGTDKFVSMTPIVLVWSTDTDVAREAVLSDITIVDSTHQYQASTSWMRSRLNPLRGYLAYDENDDGLVDPITELFGDEAAMSRFGESLNGYEYMDRFDADDDGALTSADNIFDKLYVWFDWNANRRTDPTELKDLTTLGITRIETRPSSVKNSSETYFDLADTPWTARFYGPEPCGKTGCVSFDLYFRKRETR